MCKRRAVSVPHSTSAREMRGPAERADDRALDPITRLPGTLTVDSAPLWAAADALAYAEV